MNVSMDLQIASHRYDGNYSLQFTKHLLLIGVPESLAKTSINILDGVLCKYPCKALHLRSLLCLWVLGQSIGSYWNMPKYWMLLKHAKSYWSLLKHAKSIGGYWNMPNNRTNKINIWSFPLKNIIDVICLAYSYFPLNLTAKYLVVTKGHTYSRWPFVTSIH